VTTNLPVGIIGVVVTLLAITNLVLLRRRIARTGAPLPRRSARVAIVALAIALTIGIVFIGVSLIDR
jgi:hypothetical protein